MADTIKHKLKIITNAIPANTQTVYKQINGVANKLYILYKDERKPVEGINR
ncbi:hypothetical protein FACS1894190_03680 [Spirochaetia bacterium]|nr:hypothetical protein FACS1894190_03680 [Spirochaetia bacterium]